jgi:hypothetical protein
MEEECEERMELHSIYRILPFMAFSEYDCHIDEGISVFLLL